MKVSIYDIELEESFIEDIDLDSDEEEEIMNRKGYVYDDVTSSYIDERDYNNLEVARELAHYRDIYDWD